MLGILAKMFSGGIAEPITAMGNVIDDLFTSDDERLSHAEVMERIKQRPALVQAEITKLEASHKSAFVAGWRPAIGYVAAISLFFYFVPQYAVASYIWAVKMLAANGEWVAYPASADGLMELVMALLGLGGLRTVEKLAKRVR